MSLNTSNSIKSSKLQTDLSIFNDINKFPSSNCHDYKSCIAINRLLSALRYYQSLNLHSNQDHQNIFTNFVNEVYKHPLLIEDFHHVQKQHDQQLYDISNYVIKAGLCQKCDIDLCQYSSRHYRVTNNDNNLHNMHPNLLLYGDTLDSFHFYILHLHHVGLRCIKPEKDDNYIDDKKHDDLYDHEFARIHNILSSTRSKSNRFNRVSPGNKFNIQTDDTIQDDEDHKQYDKEEIIETYLDSLCHHLSEKKVKEDVIFLLVNYSKTQEYDTESMDMDLQINGGNISQHMVNHTDCFEMVKEFFNRSRSMFCLSTDFLFMHKLGLI